MVGEISSASQEQAQGVTEINKAVNQLDQVTQRNTAIAQSAASSASQLNLQASDLRQMVQDLFMVINGSTTDQGSEESGSGSEPESRSGSDTRSAQKPPQGSGSKVVSLSQVRKESALERTAAPIKVAASGGASSLPSREDPRFEDV
jgi:hypothetical protein